MVLFGSHTHISVVYSYKTTQLFLCPIATALDYLGVKLENRNNFIYTYFGVAVYCILGIIHKRKFLQISQILVHL